MRLTRQASLVVALVAGLLAALVAYIWFSRGAATKTAPATTVEIPVPVRAIPARTELRPALFEKTAFPREQLPSDVVTDAASVQGRVSLVELPQGQPIKSSDAAPKSSMGLAFEVKRGYRAMAVPLDLVGNVGDFVKPGNRVDVLVAFVKEQQVVVRTVAQDILVLTINRETTAGPAAEGGTTGTDDKKQSSTQGGTPRAQTTPVTLALTPAQAQVVLASDNVGKIRLALRATGDSGLVPLPPANSWSLIGPLPKAAQAGVEQPPAAPPSTPQPPVLNPDGRPPTAWGGTPTTPQVPHRPSVEVIRGGQREVVVP
jgi:Flp pilus assembly protein CpaB